MLIRQQTLSDSQVREFRTALAFIEGRLEERGTIDWALSLKDFDLGKKYAVTRALEVDHRRSVKNPWMTAWRLILESWQYGIVSTEHSYLRFLIANRVKNGEITGELVQNIVSIVAPAVKVESLSTFPFSYRPARRRVQRVEDVVAVSITSGDIVDPVELGIQNISNPEFLTELSRDLDACVYKAIAIGGRLGWKIDGALWRLGDLRRAEYVQEANRLNDEHEPDEFNKGIAPCVKLLHAVVNRLGEVATQKAKMLLQQWAIADDDIHIRLWASLALNSNLVLPDEVACFLLKANEKRFWNLHSFPEIAKLRAIRYASLAKVDQLALIVRLQRRPPRSMWSRHDPNGVVAQAREFWSLRELRRIQAAGGDLPLSTVERIESRSSNFSEFNALARIDDGFVGTSRAMAVPSNPDSRFDSLFGLERLSALELALGARREGWEDDPARRAGDWIGVSLNAQLVISDLETTPDGGGAFARVWDRFGWSHSPASVATSRSPQDLEFAGLRVLRVLLIASDHLFEEAVRGLSQWLDSWSKVVGRTEEFSIVWFRLWPYAVKATNVDDSDVDDVELTVRAPLAGEETKELDTLNNPAGKLVGAFLASCPSLAVDAAPFERSPHREMRDKAIAASGRSGLVAVHRFIDNLPWFLKADRVWTIENLIAPLHEDSERAVILWRAAARQTHFREVLEVIGLEMGVRVVDLRLSRRARRSLVFSLVIDSLYALKEGRDPAVPTVNLQQMLRSVEDEIRAEAANSIQRFVKDLSSNKNHLLTAEVLFRNAVRPFLNEVWPPERSLTTPGLAKAFADLPAACGDEFVGAVESISRYLVHFDSWSMIDFGFYGNDGSSRKLDRINTREKGEAFLRLLDLCVSDAEQAVIPSDLGDALEQIRFVAPKIVKTSSFRRLSTLTRR